MVTTNHKVNPYPTGGIAGAGEACLVRLKGITKARGDFALGPVDLDVPEGSIVGLVGANGAGKTTLMEIILGIVGAGSGDVELLGERMEGMDDPARARLHQDIGTVWDTNPFPATFTVGDVRRMGRTAYARWDQGRFDALAREFNLKERAKMSELSRGMGMKLCLAVALSHGARLLLLDEATAGLDPMARDDVLGCLLSFMDRDGCGILMSTHITSDLEHTADYVTCLDGGHVAFSLPKDVIGDQCGIARCRATELDGVLSHLGGGSYVKEATYGTNVLVNDRASFRASFPDIPCDRPSIEEFMTMALKGDLR